MQVGVRISVIVGIAFTVTTADSDSDDTHDPNVVVHFVKYPELIAGVTLRDEPDVTMVAGLVLLYQFMVPAHPLALKFTVSPGQISELPGVIVGASGVSITVIFKGALEGLIQPFASVQVAVYVVFEFGETVSVEPTSKVDQITVPAQPLAVNTVEAVAQIELAPAVNIGAAGIAVTFTIWLVAELLQLPFSQEAK